ncbi:MAG: hypothetical protein QF599_10505 [Planctomycetota bacterium]|nr:hypothetical protein [Planctomycetota bacterium]
MLSRCLKLKEGDAPPGISAVPVNPMKALAEDQLEPLRGLLVEVKQVGYSPCPAARSETRGTFL